MIDSERFVVDAVQARHDWAGHFIVIDTSLSSSRTAYACDHYRSHNTGMTL
jgi:hypothetical protein